jgi:cardiolipin synthase
MIHLVPLWVTILVVSRDVILLLGTAVAHFTESRVDLTPTFLGKGTTFLQLAYVVTVIFLSSRRIDLTLMLPLLFGMISFTLLSGLHYLYRGVRHANTISG